MCTSRDIQNWLLNLPDRAEIPCDTVPTIVRSESKKRKSRHDHVLTPPGSDHDLNTSTHAGTTSDKRNITSWSLQDADMSLEFETPTQKRRRVVPNLSDPDETPRNLHPSESVSQAGSGVSQSQGSRRSTASVSRPLRTKSPTKQLGAAEISDNPIRIFALDSIRRIQDIDGRPGLRKLRETVKAISRIADGKGIFPRHDAEKIEALNLDIDVSESSFYDAGDLTEQRYGPAPSFEEVNSVVTASLYGVDEQFDEASWDREVHLLLLSLALRRRLSLKDGLVNYTPSTTAAIHSNFIKNTPNRMVDFCLYVDTESAEATSPALSEAIKYARKTSGYDYINHTPLFRLRDKPISLSIESKQRGASLDDAHLQIATWHAAQWAYLERLATKNGNTLEGLAFLPGIIVQAEDWHFVASTREGTCTVCRPNFPPPQLQKIC
ncbi:hypothetical protein K4K48_005920 [Colletotrichum sp. SAR 10_66]|nr:hypothetical protein K4K48_005920 [Colletotrichum sp. SAR 10_66]